MLVWSRNGYDLHTRNWYPPCFRTCLHPKSPRNRAIPLSFGAATAALLEQSCVKCGWCQMMACHPWICQISLIKQYKNECIRPYWIMDWRSLKCRSHLLYDCSRIILDKLAMKKSAILDSDPLMNPWESKLSQPRWSKKFWWPAQPCLAPKPAPILTLLPGQQLVSSDIVMD